MHRRVAAQICKGYPISPGMREYYVTSSLRQKTATVKEINIKLLLQVIHFLVLLLFLVTVANSFASSTIVRAV